MVSAAIQPQEESSKLKDLQDDQLLVRFFKFHEDAAFAAILARYSSLVYGVCHRILRNAADAEDAFQATFLVLVRKGATLREPGRLANWLYGVAYRTARKAKTRSAVRSRIERAAGEIPSPTAVKDMTYDQLWSVLDEEISQLPEKYSLPLVLCYLEGKTNAQAAAQLGWPEGSISRRLSRARELLRSRLAKRGMALTAALIAAVFTRPAVAAPAELVASTMSASSQVAQGVAISKVVSLSTAKLAHEVLVAMSVSHKFVISMVLTAASLLLAATVTWQVGSRTNLTHFLSGHDATPVAVPKTPAQLDAMKGTSVSLTIEESTPKGQPPAKGRRSGRANTSR